MIKRIFRSLFGRPSEVKPAQARMEGKTSDVEPKDELIKTPTLPVEQGFTFTTAMGRRYDPKSPQLKAETLEHLWSGKDISGQAYDARNTIVGDIRMGEARQVKIDEHIALDQSKGDYDDRKGHVVIPSSQFEYHGNRSEIVFPGKGGEANKNGNIFVLETSEGLIHFDNESRDYNFRPHQTPVTTGTDFSAHSKILEAGEFQIASDGAVTLPSASTLEEAKAVESQRSLAQMAESELEWAQRVSSEADYRVDGFENDHDPRKGYTVASELDEYWFLRKSSLPHMKHQKYSVESGPGGTRLYEDSYDKQPELMLKMTHEGSVTKLQAAIDGDRSLHLVWDKEAGTLKAELRASEDWVEPKPEPEQAAEVSNAYSRNYSLSRSDQWSSPKRERETLPSDFSSSGRIRSHGGGHHMMVKATGRFPNDQKFPKKFTDEKTGKTYRQSTYRVLDGSRMYIEERG